MTHRERTLAILRYQPYDRMPVVHFGFWRETLQRWAEQGHLTADEAAGWADGNPLDGVVSRKLGFDFNYYTVFMPNTFLQPEFEIQILETLPTGHRKVRDENGVVVLMHPDHPSIPSEIDHTLKGRPDWEAHYQHRLVLSPERITRAPVLGEQRWLDWSNGGLDHLVQDRRDYLYGLHCGSLFGRIRNVLGLEGVSYLYQDDPDLYVEMIDTVGELCYQVVREVLASGAKFDFGHFWEDICFKNGPLVTPSVFRERVGPHYRRITGLLAEHGLDLVSLDCDGCIDALIPIWLENGVNVMFPIEVGTWRASLAPWRAKYGRAIRGVGGVDKTVFARDRAAVDTEIERQKSLVDLGGYIPCPDHRLAPDAEWDNVRYYCERMRAIFG